MSKMKNGIIHEPGKFCGNCARFEKDGTRGGYCGGEVVGIDHVCGSWQEGGTDKTDKTDKTDNPYGGAFAAHDWHEIARMHRTQAELTQSPWMYEMYMWIVWEADRKARGEA